MKVAIIVPVLMAASLAVSAQEQTPRPLLEIIKKNVPKKNAVRPQAKLLAVTAAGKIYALPIDNMPCLAPNTLLTVHMPVIVPPPATGNMPNALKVEPVIPADK